MAALLDAVEGRLRALRLALLFSRSEIELTSPPSLTSVTGRDGGSEESGIEGGRSDDSSRDSDRNNESPSTNARLDFSSSFPFVAVSPVEIPDGKSTRPSCRRNEARLASAAACTCDCGIFDDAAASLRRWRSSASDGTSLIIESASAIASYTALPLLALPASARCCALTAPAVRIFSNNDRSDSCFDPCCFFVESTVGSDSALGNGTAWSSASTCFIASWRCVDFKVRAVNLGLAGLTCTLGASEGTALSAGVGAGCLSQVPPPHMPMA